MSSAASPSSSPALAGTQRRFLQSILAANRRAAVETMREAVGTMRVDGHAHPPDPVTGGLPS
ncbi:MAG: hypothetical protein ABI868_18120 [Acidobacteriota bacterium]